MSSLRFGETVFRYDPWGLAEQLEPTRHDEAAGAQARQVNARGKFGARVIPAVPDHGVQPGVAATGDERPQSPVMPSENP